METILYVVGSIIGIIVVMKIVGIGSFRSHTIRVATNALRETIDAFPEDSTEYLPSEAIVKATLAENYDLTNINISIKKYYSKVSPELAAYHLLDYLEHLFKQNDRPHMAAWCLAAEKSLEHYVNKANNIA